MLAPVASVAAGWLWMGETLSGRQLVGGLIVLGAVAIAVVARNVATAAEDREPGHVTARGVIHAAMAAIFIGLGAVTGRKAFALAPLDPMLATLLRVGIAAGALIVYAEVGRKEYIRAEWLRDGWLLQRLIPGTLAGTVFGMLCYMAALKRIEAGLVSTLAQTSPLWMLPMIWYRYKARIGGRVLLATLTGIAGVAMICWK